MATTEDLQFDLFIVGGGPAGLTLAERAAAHGLAVGVADKSGMTAPDAHGQHAGLALSFSDGPQRLMHLVSQLTDFKEDQRECGFAEDSDPFVDWPKLVSAMASQTLKNRQQKAKALVEKGVKLFGAKATFAEAHRLELTFRDGQKVRVQAKSVVIAIGPSIVPLSVPGAKEHALLPDELFLLSKLPQRALVVGSNYQSLELAGFLRALQVQVTVLHVSDIEEGLDREMVAKMLEFMATFYEINFVKGNINRIEKVNGSTVVTWTSEGGSELSDAFDAIFDCSKRKVPLDGLRVDKAGVTVKEHGLIEVNDHFETNVKGVYAIGEASFGGLTFASLVSKQGAVLADGLLRNQWRKADPNKLPNFLYTPIEYGFIGLGEEEAVGKFGADDVDAYYTTFKPLEWNFSEKRKKNSCFAKVIHHNKEDRVLGIHYLGPNAADIIQGFAVVVSLGLGIGALQQTVGIHPTTAEEVVNIKLNKRFDDPNDNLESGC